MQVTRATFGIEGDTTRPQRTPAFGGRPAQELYSRLGHHAAEFRALSRENDPELYDEGLLQLGGRLEREDRLDLAGEIYSHLSNPQIGATASIQRRAQTRLDAMMGTGDIGPRAEFLLHRFCKEAMEPSTLFALTAASAVFRMTRLTALARLLANPSANLFTRGIGARATAGLLAYGAEATAFPLAGRLGSFALGRSLDWSPGQMGHELASSFIILGALRVGGWGAGAAYQQTARRLGIAGEQRLLGGLFHQTGALGGILLGHRIEETVGLRAPQDNATTMLDSLALLAQFHVAGRLAQGVMGEGFASWERSVNLYTESIASLDSRIARRPGPPFSLPHLAVAGVHPETRNPAWHSIFMATTGGKGGGSEGTKVFSLPSLLRQISLFRDVRSVRLALRALYIGTTGPLREDLLSTLEKVEAGQAHGLLIRNLVADPRLQQTRFLSQDLHRRLSEQIQDLKGGAHRDTGSFFLNLTHGLLEDSSVPQEPRKPVQLTAEALLPLQEVRLHELEKLLAQHESSLPFSSKEEALAEGLQLARDFSRILHRLMKSKDRDFLTQLRNRTDLDRVVPRLEQRLLKFMKYNEGPKLEDCVLMADIDHFKSVNDAHGHQAGDAVLQQFAEVLRDPETIRIRDLIARYGGEEFLIFLFKSGRNGAEIAGERIRSIVAANPIELEEANGANQGDKISITVSIGVAEMRPLPPKREGGLPVIEGAFADAVQRADMALYAAKSVGRNRVIMWGNPDFDWDVGLLNRSGLARMTPQLEERLSQTIGSGREADGAPWVMRVNIDHLEVIDYLHGQAIANKALASVARSIRETASRSNGIAARLGEDDFFIYLNASNPAEVQQLARKVREDLSKRMITVNGHAPFRITVSIGAAEMRAGAGPLQYAIERAGRALLRAKQNGRNRIVISDE